MKAKGDKMRTWLLVGLCVASAIDTGAKAATITTAAAGSEIVTTHLSAPHDPSDARDEGLAGLAFGADGYTLVTGSSKYGGHVAVRIWDLRQQQAEPIELIDHVGPLEAISLSGDGSLLATGDYNGSIRLWGLGPRPNRTASFQWFRYAVEAVALSPDGALLAASGEDGAIGLMDLNRPSQAPAVLREHKNLVTSLHFNADGRMLASSSADGTIRVWSTRDAGATPVILREHQADPHPANPDFDRNHVRRVAFTRDGRLLIAGAGDGTVQIWNAGQLSGSPRVFTAHDGAVDAIGVSWDSRRLATAGRDRTIQVWDLTSLGGSSVLEIDCGEAWATDLAFDPTGTYVAAVLDGTVQLFNIRPTVPKEIEVR